ncbi:MAG: cytochrome c [Vicinamibacteraceae bacterium]
MAALIAGLAAFATAALEAQPASLDGARLYTRACVACHGADGRGASPAVTGLASPLPDFTDCGFQTREPDADWLAIAHGGGPVRAFDRRMPAFGDALSEAELATIVRHLRTFCRDARAWPPGELNLPRAFHTEKAYPEDEAVLTVSASTDGDAIDHELIYERRVGARSQIEVALPAPVRRTVGGAWTGGAGDLGLAFKHTLHHDGRRGRIISAAAEVRLPTGRSADGLGAGTARIEPFVSVGQLFGDAAFVQAQAGVEVPFDRDRGESEGFWRIAAGTTIAQDGGRGRAWSPMIEVLAARELEGGARVAWDLAPQVQVTLSRRQHVMLAVGVRVPVTDRASRSPAVLSYLLWDWYDGGLFSGW